MANPPASPFDATALGELAAWLQAAGYTFTTVTPTSHATVNARPGAERAKTLRDVFGWSQPFDASVLPPQAFDALQRAGLAFPADGDDGTPLRKSGVRFSSLDGLLLAHSPFPTDDADAVFFGPDTYRFARLIRAVLRQPPARPADRALRILDVGCGSGAGGLYAARILAPADELVLADINPKALAFAAVNAAHAARPDATLVQSDLYAATPGLFDVIVANPPYLFEDGNDRVYRDGQGELGTGLALRIVAEGLPRLAPGGSLILYTGAPVVDGEDVLRTALAPLLEAGGCGWEYEELDPDVFGEELATPGYRAVDRIAAVGLVVRRPAL